MKTFAVVSILGYAHGCAVIAGICLGIALEFLGELIEAPDPPSHVWPAR